MTPITDRIAAMNLPIPHGEEFMQPVTISQINETLLKLPPEKLVVVYDFISYHWEEI